MLVGPTGIIKGKVSVDQADIQGKIFDRIEAKVCLSLRRTGRIEGSAIYGEIEIEKGGVLSGEVTTIKSGESHHGTPVPKVQSSSPLPPHVVSNSNTATKMLSLPVPRLSISVQETLGLQAFPRSSCLYRHIEIS
ncbi:MAG TPA: polymer-forming cytoskeletal protein [Bradyrhizobium sp.]|nr:polymer-forming cytoskeletal protein [Bradyrhizobium sp.]